MTQLTTPAIGVCGVANPLGGPAGSFETPAAYTGAAPSVTPTTLYASSSSSGPANGFYFDAGNGDLYLRTSSSIVVTSSSGAVLDTFAIPTTDLAGQAMSAGNTGAELVVDPSGNIYFFTQVNYWYDLVQLNASGTQVWDYTVAGVAQGLFGWHDASGSWAIGVIQSRGTVLVDPSGALVSGATPTFSTPNGKLVSPTVSGGLIYDDASTYIHVLDASGSPITASSAGVPVFGGVNQSGVSNNPGAPFTFPQAGGVVEVGSTIYIADGGRGIDLFSPTGIYEGTAPSSDLDNVWSASMLSYDASNQTLLYQDSNGVASISLTDVQALVSAPAPPTENSFSDALGIGAGLTTGVTAGYFAPGVTPAVNASFDPWWQSYPDPLELSYSVASTVQVAAHAPPSPTVVPLSWSGVASGSPLSFPLAIQSAPGVYLVNADLIDQSTGVTIGSTCLSYSVGIPGDTLNFSGLSTDANTRGVQLAAELGTGDYRTGISMSSLLPNCAASPSATTCGPSVLTSSNPAWSSYDPSTGQAAAMAKSLGSQFEVQFGVSDPTDQALMQDGYWQEDVQAIMEHFAQTAPDLSYVEPFNEPNNSFLNPSTYVSECLKPFYEAVQAANAADGTNVQVIGGTVVSMDVGGWWTQLANDGAFSYMNIAGIHPYPGYDRSFEEEGTPAAIAQLRTLMTSHGASSMPIWVTEQGWWSFGEETFVDIGNWAPREWMWLRSLGVTSWNYFITEGNYQSFELIQTANGDAVVDPGAIGLMTVSNVLKTRPFLRQVSLGIPHAYGMLFGPPANGSATNDVLAVWTDDLSVAGEVSLSGGSGSVTIPTTGSLGQPGSLTVSPSTPAPLELSGAPTYLSVPAGDTLSVGPAESFGTNFALASTGATASASSSQGGANAASAVIQGSANAQNAQGLGGTPAWAATQGDSSPWIAVHFPSPETIDRVLVSTSSLGSVLPGLRDYTVELDEGGSWTTAATVTNEFFSRMKLVSFPTATNVTAVEIVPTALDYNDNVGGLPPPYWPQSFPNYPVVYSVEAYGPASGSVPATTTTVPATTTTST
ncbi:MAG: discoidin domain-containing protein [Deltaproteobacteria bacterium]